MMKDMAQMKDCFASLAKPAFSTFSNASPLGNRKRLS